MIEEDLTLLSNDTRGNLGFTTRDVFSLTPAEII